MVAFLVKNERPTSTAELPKATINRSEFLREVGAPANSAITRNSLEPDIATIALLAGRRASQVGIALTPTNPDRLASSNVLQAVLGIRGAAEGRAASHGISLAPRNSDLFVNN